MAERIKSKNILIVDDEKDICVMLCKILSNKGFVTKYALTGEKAARLIMREYFGTVLLDIVMPGISGMDLLERIRKISPRTRIIIMSGKLVNDDLIADLERKGVIEFIQKPSKIKDLLEKISGV